MSNNLQDKRNQRDYRQKMFDIRKRSHSQSTGLSWACVRRSWVCAWHRADTRSIIRQGNIRTLLRTWVRKDEETGTHTWNKLPSPPSYNICSMTCKRCFSLSRLCDLLELLCFVRCADPWSWTSQGRAEYRRNPLLEVGKMSWLAKSYWSYLDSYYSQCRKQLKASIDSMWQHIWAGLTYRTTEGVRSSRRWNLDWEEM